MSRNGHPAADAKPRVLFIHSSTHWGADVMIQTQIMRHLDKRRVEVHVAYNPGTAAQPSRSLPVLRDIPDLHLYPLYLGAPLSQRRPAQVAKSLATGAAPWAAAMARLVGYVRRHQIDIIHGLHKPRDGVPTVAIARLTGAKSLLHLHSIYDPKWFSPLAVWALHHADGVAGVSRFVAETAIAGGCRPERVHYALNGLDAGEWDPTTDGSELRRELGIAPNVPVLASISRLYAFKGHEPLLRALALVKPRVPAVRLLVVGGDDPSYTLRGLSYRAELEALARELGLAENVIFTGERSDVQRILAASDVYAMPSPEEGFGMVFAEAMAMKVPVVALNSTATPEVVEHGVTGLLAEPGDVEQLAAHLLTLIEDLDLRRRMGEAGRRRVERAFTVRRMADDIAAIYERMLARPAPALAVTHS